MRAVPAKKKDLRFHSDTLRSNTGSYAERREQCKQITAFHLAEPEDFLKLLLLE